MIVRIWLVDSALTNTGTGAESFKLSRHKTRFDRFELRFEDMDGSQAIVVSDRRTLTYLAATIVEALK